MSSNSITVHNVSANISKDTLYKFFSSAGKVVDVQQEYTSPGNSGHYLVTFQEEEIARSVLGTMNGLSLGGSKLKLDSFSPSLQGKRGTRHPSFVPSKTRRPPGNGVENEQMRKREILPFRAPHSARDLEKISMFLQSESTKLHQKTETTAYKSHEGKNCNLYVLNLSLNMNNETLRDIMGENGIVKHVCILATLDNAGRRRAFVDMSSPEEARLVIQRLNGKKVQGYELNISYAFVQRSGGPGVSLDRSSPFSLPDQRISNRQFPTTSQGIKKIDQKELKKAGKGGLKSTPLGPTTCTNSKTWIPCFNLDASLSEVNSYSRNSSPQGTLFELRNLEPVEQDVHESSYPQLEAHSQAWFRSPISLHFSNSVQDSTLLVSNLSPVACIDSDDLFKFFHNQGLVELKSARLDVDTQTGMSLGCGTLGFETIEECHRAFEVISGREIILDGARIQCKTPWINSGVSVQSSRISSSDSSPSLTGNSDFIHYPYSSATPHSWSQ